VLAIINVAALRWLVPFKKNPAVVARPPTDEGSTGDIS